MYAIYDKLDNRTIRVFPNRKALKAWLQRPAAAHFVSRGYGWRRVSWF
jgi:hypothetical protein